MPRSRPDSQNTKMKVTLPVTLSVTFRGRLETAPPPPITMELAVPETAVLGWGGGARSVRGGEVTCGP